MVLDLLFYLDHFLVDNLAMAQVTRAAQFLKGKNYRVPLTDLSLVDL